MAVFQNANTWNVIYFQSFFPEVWLWFQQFVFENKLRILFLMCISVGCSAGLKCNLACCEFYASLGCCLPERVLWSGAIDFDWWSHLWSLCRTHEHMSRPLFERLLLMMCPSGLTLNWEIIIEGEYQEARLLILCP